MQKKAKIFFQICKIHMQKKSRKEYFKKRCKKSRNAKKKMQKKSRGVYIFQKPYQKVLIFTLLPILICPLLVVFEDKEVINDDGIGYNFKTIGEFGDADFYL